MRKLIFIFLLLILVSGCVDESKYVETVNKGSSSRKGLGGLIASMLLWFMSVMAEDEDE